MSEKATQTSTIVLDQMSQMQLYSIDPLTLITNLKNFFQIDLKFDDMTNMMLRQGLIGAINNLPVELTDKVKQAIMFASFSGGGAAGGFSPMMMNMMGGAGAAGGMSPMMFAMMNNGSNANGNNPMAQMMQMQMMQQMFAQQKTGAAAAPKAGSGY